MITRRSKLYYTASGIITHVGGRPVHRLTEDWLESTTIGIRSASEVRMFNPDLASRQST